MMTKRCPACGEVKDGDEFAIDQSKARRLRLLCSSCHRGPGWREARAARDGTPIG